MTGLFTLLSISYSFLVVSLISAFFVYGYLFVYLLSIHLCCCRILWSVDCDYFGDVLNDYSLAFAPLVETLVFDFV